MGTIGFHTQNLELNMGVNGFKTKAFLVSLLIVGSNFRRWSSCLESSGLPKNRRDSLLLVAVVKKGL